MKVTVNGELIKAVRKLSKMKSIAGTSSAAIKASKIFKKGTTLRGEKKHAKRAKIRAFKKQQKSS